MLLCVFRKGQPTENHVNCRCPSRAVVVGIHIEPGDELAIQGEVG